jgi:hypothetical protein
LGLGAGSGHFDELFCCVYLAYFGGIPEQSKGQKDGTMQQSWIAGVPLFGRVNKVLG